mmetsp:Transcript_7171/g.12400  ORF Transcript_7171/g.12400 Transcript_7171/m.12400 type:complete len:80 (-) Transcript_7171:2235-2474(-)
MWAGEPGLAPSTTAPPVTFLFSPPPAGEMSKALGGAFHGNSSTRGRSRREFPLEETVPQAGRPPRKESLSKPRRRVSLV